MKTSTIAGLGLIAGAAVVEAALVPGLLVGAAVIFAAKPLIDRQRKPRKRAQAIVPAARPSKPAAAMATPSLAMPQTEPAPFEVKQAIYKTITFRIIATSVDFAANMVVIGNFTTAAGLSAFGLFGAPLFYFCHEVFWNRFAPAGTRVDIGSLLEKSKIEFGGGRALTVNRAVAKTITYEVVTITVDFAANYIATGDVVMAGGLTIFAAAISPILYFGHEKLWEHFAAVGSPNEKQQGASPLLISNDHARLANA